MADEKKIPLYFIGVHYPPTKQLTYSVKSRIYLPERDKEGNLVVGGVMQVNEHDAKAVIDKARVYRRNEGFFETFTTDPHVAAAVKARAIAGKSVGVSARMTVEQAVDLVAGTEEVKERVLGDLSVDELRAALEAKTGREVEITDEAVVVEEKSVDKEVETPKAAPTRSAANNKNGGNKKRLDSEVTDDMLK